MKINIDKISNKKISNIEVLKSGWAGELYSIKFEGDNQKYILKGYGSSEKGISDLKHEWTGINLLYNLKYPVPKPFKSDFDSGIPYILIEQIDGEDIVQENLSILHRDYHPWNVIVDKNEDVHIIDWVWGIGDYRFDLAWTCTLMERSGFKDFSEQLYKIYQELQKTGENLNEARKLESEAFFKPLIENAMKPIVDII